ncbi:MAG: ATPase domain-containing protein, partial [Acutalibacteraceae bacterium]|nr:ATPase domain-containing protein [Acutalibacteraceae bacterium]
MASKVKSIFVCSECGFESPKWLGKCGGCGAWNTLVEDVRVQAPKTAVSVKSVATATAKTLNNINVSDEQRFVTGIKELDRVLGGGIVKGSVVLLSGDPGIGKSTI